MVRTVNIEDLAKRKEFLETPRITKEDDRCL